MARPRSKLWRYSVCPRATSTSSRSDKALTTEMPTPCRAARRLVGARIEFTAGVQRRHDDFQRRAVRVFGMVVDRDAAAIIGDAAKAALLERDVDEAGVPGHGLVHGIVDHLGEEVMQPGVVGAADIHAGPPPHGFQPFQHFDRRRRIAAFVGCPLTRNRGQALAAAPCREPRPALLRRRGRGKVRRLRRGARRAAGSAKRSASGCRAAAERFGIDQEPFRRLGMGTKRKHTPRHRSMKGSVDRGFWIKATLRPVDAQG